MQNNMAHMSAMMIQQNNELLRREEGFKASRVRLMPFILILVLLALEMEDMMGSFSG